MAAALAVAIVLCGLSTDNSLLPRPPFQYSGCCLFFRQNAIISQRLASPISGYALSHRLFHSFCGICKDDGFRGGDRPGTWLKGLGGAASGRGMVTKKKVHEAIMDLSLCIGVETGHFLLIRR